MKYKIVTFCLLLVLATQSGLAQTGSDRFKTKEEVRAFCLDMANMFEPLGVSAAFDMLQNNWFITELELMHMKSETIKQFSMLESRYGKPLDAIIVKEEEVVPILYRLTVVKRYENHGLRLVFTYYYGKDDKWCLNGFKWDDSINTLFND